MAYAPLAPVGRLHWPPPAQWRSIANSPLRRSRRSPCASPAKSASIQTVISRSKNCELSFETTTMVIYLPGEPRQPEVEPTPSFDELTPREIVIELDKYIVGQKAAKRAVA